MSGKRARLFLAIVLLLLSGCATYYRATADRAADRGDWDRASRYYGKLVEAEPDDADARTKLQDARDEAAAMHLGHGRRLAAEGRLSEAITAFRRSLQYKQDPATSELLERTLAAKRKADAAEEVVAAARAEDAGDLLAARSAYQRAQALDASRRGELDRRIARLDARIAEAAELANEAQTRLSSGELTAAEQLAARALELHGANEVAEKVARDVRSERVARDHEASARQLASEEQLDAAVASARRAVEARDSAARRGLLAELGQRAAESNLVSAEAAARSEDWPEAIARYESALQYRPDSATAQQGLANARYHHTVSLAQQAELRRDTEQAIELYRRAYELRGSAEVLERLGYLESTLGRFRVAYTAPRSRAYVDLHRQLSRSGLLEQLADSLNQGYRVPADVVLATQECGQKNAFYLPNANQISVCYELIAHLASQFRGHEGDEELFTGTFVFILMHELGHAFAHVYELPITGREEDAADQLAALVLLEMEGGAHLAVAAASWFSLNARSSSVSTLAFADEHSLDQQRFFNLLCWVYGRDPSANRSVLEYLPATRAQGCPAEYHQMRRSWAHLLAPYER